MQPVKIRRCSLSRGPQKPRSPVGTRPTRHSATTVSAGSSAPNSADERGSSGVVAEKVLPALAAAADDDAGGAPRGRRGEERCGCAVGDEAEVSARKRGVGASAARRERPAGSRRHQSPHREIELHSSSSDRPCTRRARARQARRSSSCSRSTHGERRRLASTRSTRLRKALAAEPSLAGMATLGGSTAPGGARKMQRGRSASPQFAGRSWTPAQIWRGSRAPSPAATSCSRRRRGATTRRRGLRAASGPTWRSTR